MGNRNNSVESVLVTRLRIARRLAQGQGGLVTQEQLEKVQLEAMSRSRLFKAGALVEVFPGVYRFKEVHDSEFTSRMAACLWTGGLISHTSAGRLHGWDGCDSEKNPPLEIISLTRMRAREGLRVRKRAFSENDRSPRHKLPVTSYARTLQDLAWTLSEEDFAFAFECAWRKGHIDAHDWQYNATTSGVKLAPALRRALADAALRIAPMQSPLEVRTWRAMRSARVPLPVVQFPYQDDLGPLVPDFCFEEKKLVVEALGYEAHGKSREKFEKDQDRMTRLVASGYAVFPITRRMLDENEARVMERLKRALANRSIRRMPAILADPFDAPVSVCAT